MGRLEIIVNAPCVESRHKEFRLCRFEFRNDFVVDIDNVGNPFPAIFHPGFALSKFAPGSGFGGKQYAHTQVSVKRTHDLRPSPPRSQIHPVFDSCGTFFFAQIFQCCHIKKAYFSGEQHDQLRLFEFQIGRGAVAFPDIGDGAGEILRQCKSMVQSSHGGKLERYFFCPRSFLFCRDRHIAECEETCSVNSVNKFNGVDPRRQKQFVFVVLIL